jgi:hypothetical protein
MRALAREAGMAKVVALTGLLLIALVIPASARFFPRGDAYYTCEPLVKKNPRYLDNGSCGARCAAAMKQCIHNGGKL